MLMCNFSLVRLLELLVEEKVVTCRSVIARFSVPSFVKPEFISNILYIQLEILNICRVESINIPHHVLGMHPRFQFRIFIPLHLHTQAAKT
jgi:hypothetical protein